jgi:hypothetical protein
LLDFDPAASVEVTSEEKDKGIDYALAGVVITET